MPRNTGINCMRHCPVFLGMIPGLFLGVQDPAGGTRTLRAIAGVVLMGVGGITLLAPKLRLQSPLAFASGITLGLFRREAVGWPRGKSTLFSSFCLQRDCAERPLQRKHHCFSSFRPRLAGNSSDGQRRVQLA